MAREAHTLPARWQTLGVEYVVNIGDNQTKWHRYVSLCERNDRNEAEQAELNALASEVDDLFTVQLFPYAWEKFKAIESAASRNVRIVVDPKTNQAEVLGDPSESVTKTIVDTVAECTGAVKGYGAAEPELNEDGSPKLDEHGEFVLRRWRITTGKELVQFITTRAWETERDVLGDLYKALRERSHLEAGVKKRSFNLRG